VSCAAADTATTSPASPRPNPHVVQINDEERQDEAVAERVREAAELQQPHVARQLRIE
jgi:hypothetical protein